MKLLLRYGIVIFFLSSFYSQADAQFLHFNKLNHRVYANYHIGDRIAFIINETDQRYEGVITGFTDSTMILENYEFTTDEIGSLHIDQKITSHYMLKYKWSRILMIMGIGYPAIEVFNSGRVDRRVVTNGIGLMGAGLIVELFSKEYIKIDERHTLTIIHTPIRPQYAPDPGFELDLN